MILYHFTAREHLPTIMREGLRKGDVVTSHDSVVAGADGFCAVNLTTLKECVLRDGTILYGLSPLILTEKMCELYAGRFLNPDERRIIAEGNGPRFPDKTVVRIKVKILSSDRRLVQGLKFLRKHAESHVVAGNTKSNGGMLASKEEWIFFGVIPPDQFLEVLVRETSAAPWQAYTATESTP